ncbi:MAG: RluA family pseudouridine synthase [Candidatus Omnitrophota bacterium]
MKRSNPPSARFKIVYEDDAIIAVDKPSGILVVPSPKESKMTLSNQINKYLDDKGISVNAYPCHRLDRGTSGIILYAKGKRIQKIVMAEFKEKRIQKRYAAFVRGTPRTTTGTIRSAIYNRNKMTYQSAVTKYRVVEVRKGFSVVDVEPLTGRTNQIRIHFAKIGNPILGERMFAFGKDFKIKFRRLALHARSLSLRHPISNERVSLTAPMPEDMARFIGAK